MIVATSEGHAPYKYGDAWKSTVDRNGEAWRAYCEALSCVETFLSTQTMDGRDAAKSQWDVHLAIVTRKRGVKESERLKADFEIIGINEGSALRAAVEAAAQDRWQTEMGCDTYGAPLAA